MRTFKSAAMALALTISGTAMAATDGTAGTTSTGTFSATLNVLVPQNNDVQILGLQDYNFGNVQSTNASVAIPKMVNFVCLNRNTPGPNVLLTISQNGTAVGSLFNLNDGAGHSIGLTVEVLGPTGGGGTNVGNGTPYTTIPSGPGCTASTNSASVAHQINLTPENIPAGGGVAIGALSASFTALLAPQ